MGPDCGEKGGNSAGGNEKGEWARDHQLHWTPTSHSESQRKLASKQERATHYGGRALVRGGGPALTTFAHDPHDPRSTFQSQLFLIFFVNILQDALPPISPTALQLIHVLPRIAHRPTTCRPLPYHLSRRSSSTSAP